MMYEQRFSPLSQLALLLGLCGAGIMVSAVLTGLIGTMILHVPLISLADEIMKPENIQTARLLQVLTSFLIMALPAIILTKITRKNPLTQLGFNAPASGRQLLIVICMVVAGFLISGALGTINEMIPISKTAAAYFRAMEDNYNKQVMAIGKMQSAADYIFSLLVLALIPAIFEEMLFRGCLQQIMTSLVRNAFAGILITSIIFSAIHISYYGFLPRLFLGLMLGYIFYFSKNIWLNIAAHFLNNAYSLTILYALSRSGKLTPESFKEDNSPLYYGLIGAALLYFLFVFLKRESERLVVNNEDLILHPPNDIA